MALPSLAVATTWIVAISVVAIVLLAPNKAIKEIAIAKLFFIFHPLEACVIPTFVFVQKMQPQQTGVRRAR
ncbi:TPA: stage V sporulation protein S [Stenotrophomonas maltophilia]